MTVLDKISALSEFATPERVELFKSVVQNRTRYITVVLENLYQSHNASAVLRTCDCVGIQDVHAIEELNTFKVSEDIALGSSKWLDIHHYSSGKEAILQLKSKGYRIIATALHKTSVTLPDFDLSKGPAAFIYGTELKGLSQELMDMADEYLTIPMYGFTESYNISVSAAIVNYTLIQKLKNSKMDYLLSNGEKDEVMLKWLQSSVKDSEQILKRLGFE